MSLHEKIAMVDSQRFSLKFYLIKNVLGIRINDHLQLRVLYKSDMRISTAGKHIEVIRIKNNIFHIIKDKGLKGTAVNQALPSSHGGLFEITLRFFNLFSFVYIVLVLQDKGLVPVCKGV